MTSKPYKRESGYRTYTFTCKSCEIIFKIDVHDKEAKKIQTVYCPVCKGKVK